MGAPLDLTSRSPFRLRSARTLSTTLLGFEFLQRPQHVLSNLLNRPHSSVLARSTTIASSSAFSLAFALAFFPVSALRLPISNPLLLGFLLGVARARSGTQRAFHLIRRIPRFLAPRTPPPWVCRPCYPALAPCAGPQAPLWL